MIGFDLQEVKRIKDEEKLLQKIALASEIEYIQKFKRDTKIKVATLWSVKEAVFKALDINAGEISFKEIELCHKENGAPYVKLYGQALEKFKTLKANKIEISISHQPNIVGAVAIIL